MDDIKEIHILEDPQEWYSYLWGKRVCNDDLMFELMSLQVFQAGLTWSSILKMRNEFKLAFRGWRIDSVMSMSEKEITDLTQDASIIRNRRKIEACVFNANVAKSIQDMHGSFCYWVYEVLEGTDLKILQKCLSKRFKFLGPEITRMWLLAVGKIVNL
ncbi:MAG: DNA-3-methyladenine glycosylase I [SAR202 cluster bacterium]|nr:DNA-3-methyladenine glycosylase I [SAR202 cluster bacterium]|tara:strand:- start:13444 stop:13917 length:474 start_codon:yes stop_codon:yes gene_type:complete